MGRNITGSNFVKRNISAGDPLPKRSLQHTSGYSFNELRCLILGEFIFKDFDFNEWHLFPPLRATHPQSILQIQFSSHVENYQRRGDIPNALAAQKSQYTPKFSEGRL